LVPSAAFITKGVGRHKEKLTSFEMSRKNQVICITHLAQVAKFSDNHFKVEKNIKNETTNVVVKLLNKQERIEELARMLSGSDISKKTYELAEELIGDKKH